MIYKDNKTEIKITTITTKKKRKKSCLLICLGTYGQAAHPEVKKRSLGVSAQSSLKKEY